MNIELDPLPVDLILFFVSLIICGLFAFIETSITAMRLFKLKEIASTTKGYTKLFYTLEHKPQVLLITILIMTTLASTTWAVISERFFRELLVKIQIPESLAALIGIALSTIIMSIFGEIIPKSIAQSKGGTTFTSTLWIVNVFFYMLSPLAHLLNKIAQYLSKQSEDENNITEREIQFLISHIQEKGMMEHEKTEMLQNIFRMGETHVKEILIPKNDVVSLNIENSIDGLLDMFMESKFSRFPVYQDNPENIVGIVYLKDLFLALKNKENKNQITLKSLVRPIIFVPDSLRVSEVLKEFRRQKIHMGVVLDEYGSTIGIVTLEDALEEIVGDIDDEHEVRQHGKKITPLPDQKGWIASAAVDLDKIEHILKINFHAETAVTLGGFITEHLQRLPQKNEKIFYKDFCFEITNVNDKRILEIMITKCNDLDQCTTHNHPENKKE
ncbi:HlyC/CorC family transporter [bacterium]|nr:HlyC/CorC family transporter [bacterium]